MEKKEDVEKVINFVDGRHIRGRQVRAKGALGGSEQAKK